MTPRSAPVVIAAMTALALAMFSRGQPAPAASTDARLALLARVLHPAASLPMLAAP
jgi:hypothetical protein